jgi:hypothetical protein
LPGIAEHSNCTLFRAYAVCLKNITIAVPYSEYSSTKSGREISSHLEYSG